MTARILLPTAILLFVCTPLMALPVGDPEAGEQKSQVCAACHGPQGNADNPAFPKLAGQHADYLLHALKLYKSGERQNAVMAGQVANLSEDDMGDLAAYFSRQPGDLHTLDK